VTRAKTEPGVQKVVRPRPPRLAEPAVPRADTIDRLKSEVGMYSQTVARHDEAIDKWLRPIATKLPAQLQTLELSIAQLDVTVKGAAAAMVAFADETRRTINEHDERIEAVTERVQDHETKWLLLDAEKLPPRVKALEQQFETEETTKRIDTALVAQQRRYLALAIKYGPSAIAALEAILIAILALK
jgi:hypothetical protein